MMTPLFRLDPLSYFVGGFVVFFTFLTVLYSLGFMRGKKGLPGYYLYILLTAVSSLGAVFANHLIVFIVFWGFLGPLLYLLIQFGETPRTAATAKKAIIIVGGTDAFMILGIALIVTLTGSFDISRIHIPLDNKFAVAAFLFLVMGAFAKSGAMPFHTWVPDTAEDAPTSVTAFLPAALDKLLGIYFLARICLDLFQLNQSAQVFLMAIGSLTIIAAVMMALIQHDLKRLLGYHAVSQVGYMILGIGTGNPVGIAGGLFHMLNNAVYKSCLFLSSGAVEKKAGTTDLDKLGGLAKIMPVSFITFLIASMAIAGVPPLNGFASKWLIYQGVIETGRSGGHLWLLWLMVAMFGSALTLASFMKLVHAVFLGQSSMEIKTVPSSKLEAPVAMLIPMTILAILCILFGVFAFAWPLSQYVFPSVRGQVVLLGMWNASLATGLIVAALVVGFLLYLLGKNVKTRRTEAFIGGEDLRANPQMRLSGTEFYHTIEELGILKVVYHLAKEKVFDVYEMGVKVVLALSRVLKYIHNGVLPTYLAWCILGLALFFWVFFK
jgi:formate hydrogenlyase subunit 3/multisubunit Na+/H+ antiporter MnhD subunit